MSTLGGPKKFLTLTPNPSIALKGKRKASHGAELKDMAALPKQEHGFIATKLTSHHKRCFLVSLVDSEIITNAKHNLR